MPRLYHDDSYLMAVSWHVRAAAARKKVEVGSAICLHHVIEVELVVAALEDRLWRFPFLSASGEFAFRDVQMQSTSIDIQVNYISILNQSQRASCSGFRRDMKHYCPKRSSAHACVGDAHHIGDAFLQNLRRQRHIPNLRHSRISTRAAILQHENRLFIDVKIRSVDTLIKVFNIVENYG